MMTILLQSVSQGSLLQLVEVGLRSIKETLIRSLPWFDLSIQNIPWSFQGLNVAGKPAGFVRQKKFVIRSEPCVAI